MLAYNATIVAAFRTTHFHSNFATVVSAEQPSLEPTHCTANLLPVVPAYAATIPITICTAIVRAVVCSVIQADRAAIVSSNDAAIK